VSDEPSRRHIAIEIAVFVALFLIVGAAFVAFRVMREGPRVLEIDPRRPR
jgi:hypothetical protein